MAGSVGAVGLNIRYAVTGFFATLIPLAIWNDAARSRMFGQDPLLPIALCSIAALGVAAFCVVRDAMVNYRCTAAQLGPRMVGLGFLVVVSPAVGYFCLSTWSGDALALKGLSVALLGLTLLASISLLMSLARLTDWFVGTLLGLVGIAAAVLIVFIVLSRADSRRRRQSALRNLL